MALNFGTPKTMCFWNCFCMARLRILSQDDFRNLYEVPKYTDEERPFIFELDEDDKNYLNSMEIVSTKINYILNLGYFKTSQYFFFFTFQSVREDVKYIIKTYFPEDKFPMKQVSSRQNYMNRQAVLNKYSMILYTKDFEKELVNYLKSLVKQHLVTKYLLDSLIEYCHNQKVVRPKYSTLQDLISQAIGDEKLRISNKLYALMDKSLRDSLDQLLKTDDLFYQLTLVKKDQKDFSTHEIRLTVEKNKMVSDIYENSVRIIQELDLSEQNVFYYADLAEQYSIYDLRRLKQKNIMRLYLLCYVHKRLLNINDHLIDSFVYKINKYIDESDVYQKDVIYQAQLVDKENRSLAANILSLHIDKKISNHDIRSKSFAIIPENEFEQFIKKIKTIVTKRSVITKWKMFLWNLYPLN